MRFLPRLFSRPKLSAAAVEFLGNQKIFDKPLAVVAAKSGDLFGFRNHLAWLSTSGAGRIWGWEEIQGLQWQPQENQLLVLSQPRFVIRELLVAKNNDFMALAGERIAATTVISRTEEIQGNKITVAIRKGLLSEDKGFFAVYAEDEVLLRDPRIQLRIKEIKSELGLDYKI